MATVRIEYRKLKSGALSPRLITNINGVRTTEKIDLKIYRNDPHKKSKIEMCEALRAKKELQLFGHSENMVFPSKVTLSRFYEKYTKSLDIASKRKYAASLKFVKAHFLEKRITKVSRLDCQRYYDSLYREVSSHTTNSYYACLVRVLNHAIDQMIIQSNPASGIRKKKSINLTNKNVLFIDEFNQLMQHPIENKDVMKAAILSYYSGIGLSEIYKLTPKNISNGILTYTRGKSRIQVTIKLKQFVVDLIDLPFKNLPKTTNGVNKALRAWTDLAGLTKHITFYCFRHSFAVNLLLNDVNIKHVKDLMGHTSLKHTLTYLHFVEMIKNSPTENLPDLELPPSF